MAPHLEAITQRMMESLTSDEGVKVGKGLVASVVQSK